MEYNEADLIALHNANKTYTQIADIFKVTRATISGRLRRLRTKGLVQAREKKLRKQRKARTKKIAVAQVAQSVDTKPKQPIRSKRYTFQHNRGQRQLGKADLYAMLKEAVENTK